jgi:protein-disulfide isomerase
MAKLSVPVSKEDHIFGSNDAPVTLLEYGDYECPYCGMAYPIVKKIQQQFGNDLRFVFRNFPIVDSHPHAEIAAMTAEFSGSFDKFWEMHDILYENQEALELENLMNYAASLGLSPEKLQKAIENETFVPKIRADFMSGVRSGVNGTPSFYINGNRHAGSFEYEELAAAIMRVLR